MRLFKLVRQLPPHFYFITSAIFHYLGPSFAVLLFARVNVSGVAWLRITSAALIFIIWKRPWRAFLKTNRETRMLIIGLGTVFAAMNYSFYYAIDRLPLGTVAAIEFIGPITLALVGTHTWRNLVALSLAVAGVYLLADVRFEGESIGFIWAFTNAIFFIIYIILAHRLAKSDPNTISIDRLGAAMVIAAIVITPFGIKDALPAISDIVILSAGIAVGLSSSVIPYILDQLAMAKLLRSTYALFVALLPATAVVIGFVILGQVPSWLEIIAVGLVIGGILIVKEVDIKSK